MGEAQFGLEENKKILVEPWEWGEREYSKTILLLSRARAGFLTVYLFFLY
jgi:hypothetical protein